MPSGIGGDGLMAKAELFSVLVGNVKGGCGKTPIATHLASAFAGAGHATVLADCDRQRSSLGWLRRRPEGAAAIAGLDWSKASGEVPDGAERLVIDAPAAMRHRDAKDLVALADIIVVPVLPSLLDEDATAYFLRKLGEIKAVRKRKRIVALVANRIRGATRAAEDLERYFAGHDPPILARLRDSQLYPSAAQAGVTIFEAGGARARSYVDEWRPLLDLVGLARPAAARGKAAAPALG
jgi:chromosome partitioning protein